MMFDRKWKSLNLKAIGVVTLGGFLANIALCGSSVHAVSERSGGGDGDASFFGGLDPDLKTAIDEATPEFTQSLKRRFTNVGVSEAFRTKNQLGPSITFPDIFAQDGTNDITLKNLIIQKHPNVRLTDIVPNLLESNLRIKADWFNVVIEGSHELVNSTQLRILPVRNLGNFRILIEKVAAQGVVGFQTYNGALKTTNFNIDFDAENVNVEVEYYNPEIKGTAKSIQSYKTIDTSIAKHLKRELYWRLQESLRERLDSVLVDYSLDELFRDNQELSQKYISQSTFLSEFLNQFVDDFINEARHDVIKKGYHKVKIPDIHTEFATNEYLFLTIWGRFEAKNGTLEDLSTVKRSGVFSAASIPNSSKVQIFGSLSLEQVKLHYSQYSAKLRHTGPTGEIMATVGQNSISFKLWVQVKVPRDPEDGVTLAFGDIDVKVDRFDDLKVNASGLGIFSWLLSYIFTWVAGSMKKDIIDIMEKRIESVLMDFLPKSIKV